MTFWDQQFAGDAYKYGTAPNAFLAQHSACFAPGGSVLLPGDGEGRNSVWLAAQGFAVQAIDSSRVGLDKASALAAQRGVVVHTVWTDLADWQPAPQAVDAVALIYVHLSAPLRTQVLHRALRALRPGGVLVLEAFHPQQLTGYTSGGPKQVELLYTLEQLRADAASAGVPSTERFAREGNTQLNEGPGHQGLAFVTQWVVQRA